MKTINATALQQGLGRPPYSAPRDFFELGLPPGLRILALAPHPDDFDAIGVTMKRLHDQGHALHVAVVTSGASGVAEGWNGLQSPEEKTQAREAEQQASCRFFGLPPERLRFLRLWEATSPVAQQTDHDQLRATLLALQPQLVFLPHGNDSNRTHRRTYEAFRTLVLQEKMSLWACLNQDAKTLSMRTDLLSVFGEEEAQWKAQLLRLHVSQQERNLATRGSGFDERVLALNREIATQLGSNAPYAEAFELEAYGN